MRTTLRWMSLGLAVLAAGCTNDKPTLDTSSPIAGPTTKLALPMGGCESTIGDRVWFDLNCDGIQDKDETSGPSGVTVTLINCNTHDVVLTTTTGNNGLYSFQGIPEGTYQVCFQLPDGFEFSPKDQGGTESLDSDADKDGCSPCFTVECDKPNTTIDAGLCEKEEPTGCRFTGGGNSEFEGDEYTFGGQAGANSALEPEPEGEWEHNQHDGPDGSFAFHGGGHNPPDGTHIDRIECSDPGYCDPARKAPAHQLDFWGVGQFDSVKDLPATMSQYVTVHESLHWFEVNIDDAGEPGKATDADCPEDGFGLHGSVPFVNCDCGDFYRITIHATTNPQSTVIYTVHGYFTGNFQIHPLTGYDLH